MGLDQRTVKPSDGGLMPEVPVAAAPAPAEVAEGAGRPSWDKIISDLRDVVSKLPAAPSLDETTRPKFTEIPIAKCPRCGYGENAAPSLSREEWGMLYRLLDKEIPPGVKTAEFEPWIALRAKFREQEREGKAPKC
jgi:hypothetical protein